MRTIRENLVLARDVLMKIPRENLDLHSWYRTYRGPEPECGTIACAAGWLALDKNFNSEKNIKLCANTDSESHPEWNGAFAAFRFHEQEVFGDRAFRRLFAPRGNGEWDKEILACQPHLSDNELAVARFNRAIFELDKEHADNS